MNSLENHCNHACEAATSAAELIKSRFAQQQKIRFKGEVDLVTEVDLAAEQLIKELLKQRTPEISFYGEEDGGEDWRRGKVWVVDPLDGTTNFANHLPHFCVSIALCDAGQPVAGCIVHPMTGEVYRAWQGGGAWCNNERLNVSQVQQLNQALAVTGFPYNRRECLDQLLMHLDAVLRQVQGVRRMGSAALDLCYLARGIFSLYWEINLKPWDIAAGTLLVKEAGGQVSKFDGSEMQLDSCELLASNGFLHRESSRLLLNNKK